MTVIMMTMINIVMVILQAYRNSVENVETELHCNITIFYSVFDVGDVPRRKETGKHEEFGRILLLKV